MPLGAASIVAGISLPSLRELQRAAELAHDAAREHDESCGCFRARRRCAVGLALWREGRKTIDRLNAASALKSGVGRHPLPPHQKRAPAPPAQPYSILDAIQARSEERAHWRYYWIHKRRAARVEAARRARRAIDSKDGG